MWGRVSLPASAPYYAKLTCVKLGAQHSPRPAIPSLWRPLGSIALATSRYVSDHHFYLCLFCQMFLLLLQLCIDASALKSPYKRNCHIGLVYNFLSFPRGIYTMSISWSNPHPRWICLFFPISYLLCLYYLFTCRGLRLLLSHYAPTFIFIVRPARPFQPRAW
jgi:hypothetical protein